MGIPTDPQQGRNPAGTGVPSGRAPGNRPPVQPQQRPSGIPTQQGGSTPQQRPAQQQRPAGARPGGIPNQQGGIPRQQPSQQRPPQQRPAQQGGLPQQRPAGAQQQRPPQQAQRPAQQPRPAQQRPAQEQLPSAPEQNFNDPFGADDDLFSDVPKVSYDESFQDDFGFEDDEDTFSTIPGATNFEDEEIPQRRQEAPQQPAPRVQPAATPRRLQGSTKPPAPSRSSREEFSEDFVDRDKRKLKPFGKPKKAAKAGDFDPRKNLEGQRKLYRGIVVAALVALVGFGAFNALVPKESVSYAEIEEIAAYAAGDTGFPTVKGEGFALNFMDSLLDISPGPEGLAKRTAALGYFYGAAGDSKAASEALTAVGNVSQQVVYGPVALDSTPLTENAASYEIGVLLSTTEAPVEGSDPLEGSAANDAMAASLRWVSFNVNVYYDEAKDSFAIAPNSPTLLPAPSVEAPSLVPAGEPLGEPVDSISESVRATVVGFLSGYRESTKENFDKILQYIGTNADESLRTGLGGQYQFATPDDPSSSVAMEVFESATTAGELKVALVVDWQIPTGENSSVTFPSHYVLTLTSTGGGDYTVTKFAPYYWTEAVAPEE